MPHYVTSTTGQPRAIVRERKRRERDAVAWVNPEWRTLADDPEHVAIARKIARQFAARNPAIGDEYESEAYWALCLAAWQFRPERATCPFPVYMGTVIRQQLIDLKWRMDSGGIRGLGQAIRFKRERPEVNAISRDIPLFIWDEPFTNDREEFEVRIRGLSTRSRCVLRWIYLDGRTRTETAALMGVSTTVIDRIHGRAMESLRARPEFAASSIMRNSITGT